MPNTTIQRKTTFPVHGRSREQSRRITTQARAHVIGNGCPQVHLTAAQPAVVQERARIARELHDSVAQTLYAISLVAGRALELPDLRNSEHTARLFDQVLQLAGEGQAEVRALLANLWAAHEPTARPINEALTALTVEHERRHGIQVRLTLAPENDAVPADKAEALVAIAREALSNVARHAGARRVDIEFDAQAADFTLVIADDGRGFDPALARAGHYGLHSMRERAIAVGGQLKVISATGAGTRLRVRVPRERSTV